MRTCVQVKLFAHNAKSASTLPISGSPVFSKFEKLYITTAKLKKVIGGNSMGNNA